MGDVDAAPRGGDRELAAALRARTAPAAVLAVAAALALSARPARAGNEDSFLFGDHAAMMAGAVIATASGTGTTWYPAGLGQNVRGRLELSGTAFTLRLRRRADGLVALSRRDAPTVISTLRV